MSRLTLSDLSDRELLGRLKSLVEKERATTVEILLHLNEVERRRLYLTLGYPSLFEYCTRHLGYSSSAAGRRISAARCVRDYPEVLLLLEKNEMTLVTVSRVASVLTAGTRDDLLGKVRRKTEREVEEVLASYRPPVAFRDRVKPVCVAVAASPDPRGLGNSGHVCPVTPSGGSAAGGGSAAPSQACTEKGALLQPSTVSRLSPPDMPRARLERKLLVQFLASEAFMQKFEKARALLSNRLDTTTFENVFEAMIDEFLERHSPESKNARREKRETRRQENTKPTARTEIKTETETKTNPVARTGTKPDADNRHIPASVRDRVFARDKGRCTFIGTTGERCAATHGLQLDHIVPYARGGRNTADNLRLLCGRHNRLEAERVYGANTVRCYRQRE
jgi:5-methylcytosine-specific restriction endonuclease McrA